MLKRVLIPAAALALAALSALPAQAYFTTLVPGPGSDLPADRLVISWTTDLTSGTVTTADLTSLQFELYGNPTFVIVEDVAIVGGVVQALAGNARALGDIDFSFDLDLFNLGGGQGLLSFDNNVADFTPPTDQSMLDAWGTSDTLGATVWVPAESPPNIIMSGSGPAASSTVVPLPAAAPLLAGALGLLGLVARRRRAARG
ncbi:hypothetical protein P2H44_05445 [Albimonas sp. CAU 1670]|uniref:hypothetical protein n=1 Tax=Albimonas sp. CAU 1670 TaxID=3032599 RepID=UPI0023DB31E0|nr:hypothetical protein [Albimonas sp. CAU 1670]MDF2231991.1 hypothetical protein [Albimonas sp. CAU 1670]